jgi:hypothetical protein
LTLTENLINTIRLISCHEQRSQTTLRPAGSNNHGKDILWKQKVRKHNIYQRKRKDRRDLSHKNVRDMVTVCVRGHPPPPAFHESPGEQRASHAASPLPATPSPRSTRLVRPRARCLALRTSWVMVIRA